MFEYRRRERFDCTNNLNYTRIDNELASATTAQGRNSKRNYSLQYSSVINHNNAYIISRDVLQNNYPSTKKPKARPISELPGAEARSYRNRRAPSSVRSPGELYELERDPEGRSP